MLLRLFWLLIAVSLPSLGVHAAVESPTNIKLIQWNEGQVTLYGSLPQNATHYRVYLSSIAGQLGTLAATITPIDYPDGPAVFNAAKGKFFYATIRGYNASTGEESQNSDQIILQMYEILNTGYTLSSFFHEPYTEITWAIGVNKPTGNISVLRSTDYFSTYTVVKTFLPAELNYPSSPYLTFYIDKFGNLYVSARPLPLISKDRGANWTPISTTVSFMSPDTALLVPGWSISENESGLIIFAEYGGYGQPPSTTPHRRLLKSTDPSRVVWTQSDIGGRFKHIHSYQINPYNEQVHFLSLGDGLDPNDPTPGPDNYGLFISLDGGVTFGSNVIAGLDGFSYNGPCTTTFFPDQRALVTNDSNGERGYWWGFGRSGWSSVDLRLSLINDVFPLLANYCTSGQGCGYPVTPWSAIAIRTTYETYGVATSDNIQNNIPMPLFRYDGDTGKVTVIAASRNYDTPFRYMSTSRGNVIPTQAKYVFNDGFGGMRIPRLPQ